MTKEEQMAFDKGYKASIDATNERTRCNGWTNYATWRINLEILSDTDWNEEMAEGIGQFESLSDFADYLEDRVDEAITGFGEQKEEHNLALDYARAFASEVNYYEIAKHIAEDYPNLIKK